MFGSMAGAGPGGGGVWEQREAAFGCTAAAPSSSPKLFLAAGSEEAFSPPAPELAGGVATVSLTSTLQAPAEAVPFSRRGASCSPSGADRRRRKSRSRSQRPWEARPVGVGLAGALNGDDALPPAATVLTGQGVRQCRWSPSPREMEASEDYTRVIARGPNPRTTHIFDDRVVVVDSGSCDGEDEFLRWCHGCSKDLGQGKDIFMYREEMAFCSHECRYHGMLIFDQEESS